MSRFKIEDIVYHVADEMQEPAIVTGIVERCNRQITYLVGTKGGETECYEIELTNEKKIFL